MLNVEFLPKDDETENPLGIILDYDLLSKVTTEVLSDQYQLKNNESDVVTAIFTHADGIEFITQNATDRNEYTLIDANGIEIPAGQTITFHVRVKPTTINPIISGGSGKTVLTANISIKGIPGVVPPPPPSIPDPPVIPPVVTTRYYFTATPRSIEFSDTKTLETVDVVVHEVVTTDGVSVERTLPAGDVNINAFEVQLNGIGGLTTTGLYESSGKLKFDLNYPGGVLAPGADMDVLVDTRIYPGANSKEIALSYKVPELVITSEYWFIDTIDGEITQVPSNVLQERGHGLFRIEGVTTSDVKWSVKKDNLLPEELQALIVGPEGVSSDPPLMFLRMTHNSIVKRDLTTTITITAEDGARTASIDVPVVFKAPTVATPPPPPSTGGGGGGRERFDDENDDDFDESEEDTLLDIRAE